MSSVGEVVAQLMTVVERLDRAVVGTARGQAEAGQAHESFAEVGRGSDHQLIRTAVAASDEAAAKAGKAARLLAEAAGHFTAYANTIAPGSVSAGKAFDSAPTGEQLVSEADRAEDGFRKLSKRVVQKAESAGETGKKLVDFLSAAKPSGTPSTTQPLPPAPRSSPATAGTPGDAAQAVVITAAAVVAVILKAASSRRKRKEQKRDRPEDIPRTDPGTGEGGSGSLPPTL